MKRGNWIILMALWPVFGWADGQFGPLFGLSIEHGGDRFDTFVKADGSDWDVHLGEGLHIYTGAYMDLPDIPILPRPQVRTRLGYKLQLAETLNTSYLLSSVPLELGVRFAKRCQTYDHLGCGFFVEFAGVTHLAAQYDFQGSPDRHQEFDSPLGLNIKVGWYFINLGYSNLTYQADGNDYDASSFNFGVEMPFPLGN